MYKRQWTCYRDMIADHGAEEKEEERKRIQGITEKR